MAFLAIEILDLYFPTRRRGLPIDKVMRPDQDCHILKEDKREIQRREVQIE